MILMGPFYLRMFCDSSIVLLFLMSRVRGKKFGQALEDYQPVFKQVCKKEKKNTQRMSAFAESTIQRNMSLFH